MSSAEQPGEGKANPDVCQGMKQKEMAIRFQGIRQGSYPKLEHSHRHQNQAETGQSAPPRGGAAKQPVESACGESDLPQDHVHWKPGQQPCPQIRPEAERGRAGPGRAPGGALKVGEVVSADRRSFLP